MSEPLPPEHDPQENEAPFREQRGTLAALEGAA